MEFKMFYGEMFVAAFQGRYKTHSTEQFLIRFGNKDYEVFHLKIENTGLIIGLVMALVNLTVECILYIIFSI